MITIIRKDIDTIFRQLDNCCIVCTGLKNLQNNSIKVWLTLFKHGKNLYEH